jgi:hypothetical protein
MAKKSTDSNPEPYKGSSKKSSGALLMKKKTLVLPFIFTAAILVAFASLMPLNSESSIDSPTNPASKTAKKPSSPKKMKPYKARSPGYDMPELSSTNRGVNAILSASFIYWKPQQDEFSLGVTGPRPGSEQKVCDFKSNYRPGFKAGLGLTTSYDSWSLFLEYTRLTTKQKTAHYTSPDHPMIMSPWVGMTVADQGLYDPTNSTVTNQISKSSASNYWNFNFELFDLLLSRSYYVGKKLVFNPFLAARGAIINQRLNVSFLYATNAHPLVNNTIYSHNKNNTQQIGPRLGLDMNWLIGSSFRFGGTLAGGLLYTQYHLIHTETLNGTSHANTHYNPHAFRFNCDAALQFGWRVFSPSHRKYVDCFFKYEAIAFWQQNMVSGLTTTLNDQGKKLQDGNLYLQGGTFNLAFNF